MSICNTADMSKIRNIAFDLGGVVLALSYEQAVRRFEEIGLDVCAGGNALKQEQFFIKKPHHKNYDGVCFVLIKAFLWCWGVRSDRCRDGQPSSANGPEP